MNSKRIITKWIFVSLVFVLSSLVISTAIPNPVSAFHEDGHLCENTNDEGPTCIPSVVGIPDPTLNETTGRLTRGIASIAGGFALLFLVIGGFRYITSAGDEEKLKNAKAMIRASIIGMLIIFLAFVILTLIVNFAAQSIGA